MMKSTILALVEVAHAQCMTWATTTATRLLSTTWRVVVVLGMTSTITTPQSHLPREQCIGWLAPVQSTTWAAMARHSTKRLLLVAATSTNTGQREAKRSPKKQGLRPRATMKECTLARRTTTAWGWTVTASTVFAVQTARRMAWGTEGSLLRVFTACVPDSVLWAVPTASTPTIGERATTQRMALVGRSDSTDQGDRRLPMRCTRTNEYQWQKQGRRHRRRFFLALLVVVRFYPTRFQ